MARSSAVRPKAPGAGSFAAGFMELLTEVAGREGAPPAGCSATTCTAVPLPRDTRPSPRISVLAQLETTTRTDILARSGRFKP